MIEKTPKTNAALREILTRTGELSGRTAPEILVKLCRELEENGNKARAKNARYRDELERLMAVVCHDDFDSIRRVLDGE